MNLAPRIAILLLSALSSLAQTAKTGGSADASSPKLETKLETMPQSLEVRFALSALPPHLRDGATAYILDPAAGYVVNRKGSTASAASSCGRNGHGRSWLSGMIFMFPSVTTKKGQRRCCRCGWMWLK